MSPCSLARAGDQAWGGIHLSFLASTPGRCISKYWTLVGPAQVDVPPVWLCPHAAKTRLLLGSELSHLRGAGLALALHQSSCLDM